MLRKAGSTTKGWAATPHLMILDWSYSPQTIIRSIRQKRAAVDALAHSFHSIALQPSPMCLCSGARPLVFSGTCSQERVARIEGLVPAQQLSFSWLWAVRCRVCTPWEDCGWFRIAGNCTLHRFCGLKVAAEIGCLKVLPFWLGGSLGHKVQAPIAAWFVLPWQHFFFAWLAPERLVG